MSKNLVKGVKGIYYFSIETFRKMRHQVRKAKIFKCVENVQNIKNKMNIQ